MFKKSSRPLYVAAWALAVSGLLHLIATFFSATGNTAGADTVPFILIGLFYIFVAWALAEPRRWLSYIMFVITLVGTVLATFSYTKLPIAGVIAIADFSAALSLAAHLWSKPANDA